MADDPPGATGAADRHADHGSLDDLRSALESTRALARELLADGRAQVGEYETGAGPFPERRHILALLAAGYVDVMAALIGWCDRAIAETDGWPSTTDPGTDDAARRILADTLQRHGPGDAVRSASREHAAGPG